MVLLGSSGGVSGSVSEEAVGSPFTSDSGGFAGPAAVINGMKVVTVGFACCLC